MMTAISCLYHIESTIFFLVVIVPGVTIGNERYLSDVIIALFVMIKLLDVVKPERLGSSRGISFKTGLWSTDKHSYQHGIVRTVIRLLEAGKHWKDLRGRIITPI